MDQQNQVLKLYAAVNVLIVVSELHAVRNPWTFNYKVKLSLYRPGETLRIPGFQDNRRMKVVRLSSLRNGHLYPPGSIPGTYLESELTPGS
jgi:hypothetical protein